MEKRKWIFICAAVLMLAAIALTLFLLMQPDAAAPEPTQTAVQTAPAAASSAVSSPPLPTSVPAPVTMPPAITPPAAYAAEASGSDVILSTVTPVTGTDLSG